MNSKSVLGDFSVPLATSNVPVHTATPKTTARLKWMQNDVRYKAPEQVHSTMTNHIEILLTDCYALERSNASLIAALEMALPRLAHTGKCGHVRPTEEWGEHGSMSFDNCACEISVARAALSAAKL